MSEGSGALRRGMSELERGTAPAKRRVSRDEALLRFLQLGPVRTIRRLHDSCLSDPDLLAPSFNTLRAWCFRDGWITQAEKYDQTVRQESMAISVQADAKAMASLASAFNRVALRSIRTALSALKREATVATTTGDVLALVTVAIRASEQADRLVMSLTPEPAHRQEGATGGTHR